LEAAVATTSLLAPLTPEQIANRERTRPRTYDLTDPDECARLLRETAGYAQVSLHYGTDDEGRRYASEALNRALKLGYRLVPPN
jgi:hypothetical protein